MIYRFATIYADLLAGMGESPALSPVFGEEEAPAGLPVRRLIRKLVPECGAEILLAASPDELDTALPFGRRPEALSADCGRIRLPDDFLRLVAFRMPDWKVTLRKMPDENALISKIGGDVPPVLRRMRTSRFPFMEMRRDAEQTWLYYYGTALPEATPSEALYTARPRWSPDSAISLPQSLYSLIMSRTIEKLKAIWSMPS